MAPIKIREHFDQPSRSGTGSLTGVPAMDRLAHVQNERLGILKIVLPFKLYADLSWWDNMARLDGETSNRLFETLEDWNAYLERLAPHFDEVAP